MGKIAQVDIVAKGELILKKGERISARHIRKIESAKLKTLDLPKGRNVWSSYSQRFI